MNSIEKARSISIWIFIIPFIAVNVCLILVTQFHSLFPNQRSYEPLEFIHDSISQNQSSMSAAAVENIRMEIESTGPET